MRRESSLRRGSGQSDVVAEAARRRLDLLSRELAAAGVLAGEPATNDEATVPEPLAVTVPVPGRHASPRALPAPARATAWLQERLPATLQGRVALGSSQLVAVALVAAVGLAVAAVVVLRGRPEAAPVPPAHPVAGFVTPAGSPSPTTDASATPAAGGTIVVDVAGRVRRPGVATLPAGSRVVDAIRHAGGAKPGVDLGALNLARKLTDGEQVLVGVSPPAGVAAAAAGAPGSSDAGPLVNLNTATEQQLESLPGVGPVTAGKIVAWRQAHGSFTAVDDLLEVDGIGDKTLADIAPHVTL